MATVLTKHITKERHYQQLFTGSPIEVTSSFQDMSDVINTKGADSVFIWIDYSVGTSTDIQLKALGGLDKSSLVYQFPIETVSSTKIELTTEVREVPDANGKFVFEVVLNRGVPYLKLQIKDAGDGSGQLLSAKITFKY